MGNCFRVSLGFFLFLAFSFPPMGFADETLSCAPPAVLTPGRLNCHTYFTVEITKLKASCAPASLVSANESSIDDNDGSSISTESDSEGGVEAPPTSAVYSCEASYKAQFSPRGILFADLPANCELPKTSISPSKYFCGVEPQNPMKDWSETFVIAQPCSENEDDIKYFCKQKARSNIESQIGKPIRAVQYNTLEEYDYLFLSPNGTQCCK